MALRSLEFRFALAGCLLVMTTVASILFSALNFARLSEVVDDVLRESQQSIDLATDLAGSLEREDDALLLAISGEHEKARQALLAEQERGNSSLSRLVEQLWRGDAEERKRAEGLRREIEEYRAAGTTLLATSGEKDSLALYHRGVNPLLQRAVATCGRIREINFRTMERAGIQARDAANRATWTVAAIAAAALLLGTVVSAWLARSIVVPVRDLTASVDAVRQGDFQRRVSPSPVDELDRLAEGFNRMAETLGEYRRSSLGELLAAKTTLESTLNALPDAVIVIAPGGSLAAVNTPARAILVATQAERARDLAELPLRSEHQDAVSTALSGRPQVAPRTDFGQVLAVSIDGRPRRFLVSAVPIPEFVPGQFGAVVVLDDVTEFARLDEMRSELIGVASHELKTPLTSIRMNLMLLSEEAKRLDARQREMITAALLGCEELGSTIEELLDMTRIEAGQLRLNLAPVDLCGLLHQVMNRLQPRFDDAGVHFVFTVDFEPAMVIGDAARLASVFTNILVNALKYSPQRGQVRVAIASRQNAASTPPAMLQVAVTDSGPGIPAECRERVFEKFFRVEHHQGNADDGVRGTGIGLYLCREILLAHGGAIWCEPGENGIGTRVALCLPRG